MEVGATLMIAAAAIVNGNDEILLVRKRGTLAFMQPGGKIEAGETPEVALRRELSEELQADFTSHIFSYLGRFEEVAANEVETRIIADVYYFEYDGSVTPRAEIAELRWHPLRSRDEKALAPLTKNKIIPKVLDTILCQ